MAWHAAAARLKRPEGRPVDRGERLIREIGEAEALVSRLQAERETARTRLAVLRAELALGQGEPGILGDTAAVTALLDRLLHHGHVLKCGPRSWRTRTHADLRQE